MAFKSEYVIEGDESYSGPSYDRIRVYEDESTYGNIKEVKIAQGQDTIVLNWTQFEDLVEIVNKIKN